MGGILSFVLHALVDSPLFHLSGWHFVTFTAADQDLILLLLGVRLFIILKRNNVFFFS